MEAPKSGLFDKADAVVPVFDERDTAITAVPVPAYVPPEPAPLNLQQRQSQLSEAFQNIRDTQSPVVLDSTPEFTAESIPDLLSVRSGSFGATVAQGFDAGFLGALFDTDRLSVADRVRLEQEAGNYMDRNPYTGLVGHMMGRFGSDLPVDIGVTLATGGLGAFASAVARTGRATSIAVKVARSIERLRELHDTGNLGSKLATGAVRDTLEGFAAGVISEQARVQMGRGGDFESSLRAGLNDAAVAPLFGMFFRGLGEVGKKALGISDAKRISKDVTEELLTRGDLRPAQAKNFEQAAELAVAEKILKMQDQPDPVPVANKVESAVAIGTNKEAHIEYTRIKNRRDLVNFNNKYLHPDDRHLSGALADLFEARAKGAGMTLEQYLKVKKLAGASSKGEPESIFTEAATIIRAQEANLSAVDYLHEVGHIMRSDLMLTPTFRKAAPALRKRYGVGGSWTREQEEALARDFVRAISRVAKQTSRKKRFRGQELGLPQQVADAFQEMAQWLWRTYERWVRRDVPNELLDAVSELFRRQPDLKNVTPAQRRRRLELAERGVLRERQAQGTTTLLASGGAPDGGLFKGHVKDVPDIFESHGLKQFADLIRQMQKALGPRTKKARKKFDNTGVKMRVELFSKWKGEVVPSVGWYQNDMFFPEIVVSRQALKRASPKSQAYAITHEIAHAATMSAIDSLEYTNPGLRKDLDVLLDVAKRKLPNQYAFTNRHEFIAEAFSNPKFQAQMASIVSDETKRISGTRGTSLWSAFMNILTKALGLSKNEGSLLEATLKVGSEILEAQKNRFVSTTKYKGDSPPTGSLISGVQTFVEPLKDYTREGPVFPGDEGYTYTFLTKDAFDEYASRRKKIKAKDPSEAAKNLVFINDAVKQGDIRETATIVPHEASELGKKVLNLKKNHPVLHWQNTTLNLQLRQLGKVGNMIADLGVDAMNLSGKLHGLMHNMRLKAFRNIPEEDLRALRDRSEYTFETVRLNPDNTLTKETSTVSLNGFQRLKLSQYCRDGAQDLATSKRAKHSAGAAIISPGRVSNDPKVPSETPGGVEIDGKTIVLTREQRDKIASGSLLSDGEKRILGAFDSVYRAVKPEANSISQRLAGRNIFSEKNHYYTTKLTTKNADNFDDLDASFSSMFNSSAADYVPIMDRTGLGTLRLSNPFDELTSYINRIPHVVGHLEYNKSLDVFLKAGRADLEKLISPAYMKNLEDLAIVSKGDHRILGKDRDGAINTIFSLRQLGILAFNPSATLKQLGSGASAVATRLLNTNVKDITLSIAKFLLDPKARAASVREMKQRIPAFAQRQAGHNRMFDLDEIGTGNAHIAFGKEELSAKDILRLARNRDIRISEAAVQLVEKGLVWIRIFDEATMAAIWQMSKKTIKEQKGKGPYSDEVTLFTRVMMDSQPTRTPTTTSLNQMKGGIGARMFTQFSTQPRKNFELFDAATTKYINQDPALRDLGRAEYISVVIPLALQTAYAAAAGSIATSSVALAVNTLESKESARARRRAERKRQREANLAADMFNSFVRSGLGQVPGPLGIAVDSFYAGMVGDHVFPSTVPVVGEFVSGAAALSDRDISELYKNFGILMGVPSVVNKAIKAASTRLE